MAKRFINDVMRQQVLFRINKYRKEYEIEPISELNSYKTPHFRTLFAKTFGSSKAFEEFAVELVSSIGRGATKSNCMFNAEQLIAYLGFDKQEVLTFRDENPEIFLIPLPALSKTIQTLGDMFYFSPDELAKIVKNNPKILFLSPSEITKRAITIGDIFQFTKYTVFDFVHKFPNVLLFDKEFLKKYITDVAKIFKVHQNKLRNAIYNNPDMLSIPIAEIKKLYDTLYAYGFVREDLRHIFIDNSFNFNYSSRHIIDSIEFMIHTADMTKKEALRFLADFPFSIYSNYPLECIQPALSLNISKKYLKKFQYSLQSPYQSFLLKYIFVRTTRIELQLDDLLQMDIHKIFARYFFLRTKYGFNYDYSKELYMPSHRFERKYKVSELRLCEEYPLTMDKIDGLFKSYNALGGKIYRWFPIEKPKNFRISPFLFSAKIFEPKLMKSFDAEPLTVITSTDALIRLGFTYNEIDFITKNCYDFKNVTVKNISDVYTTLLVNGFTLENSNWLVLHNPSLLRYDSRALSNRFYMISKHYELRFFCRFWPECI